MNWNRSRKVTKGRVGGVLRRLAAAVLTMGSFALGSFALGGAVAQGAPTLAPDDDTMECWQLTSLVPAGFTREGAMRCTCSGTIMLDWGPIAVGNGQQVPPNGQLQSNCHAAEFTRPAYYLAAPGGPFDLVPVKLDVVVRYFECSTSGCYWIGGNAQCKHRSTATSGLVTSYRVVGSCDCRSPAPTN